MSKKVFLLILFFCATNITFYGQTKNAPKSIINASMAIKKFHEKAELDEMNKGVLLDLYFERIKILVNRIPFTALTNKRGITLEDVGVPNIPENNKLLERQHLAILNFMSETEVCEKALSAYADKKNIVNAILAYETIIKDLRMLFDE